jgi:threonylcarbamoyladenosine tRNA methylthiotransferase CDKAL1
MDIEDITTDNEGLQDDTVLRPTHGNQERILVFPKTTTNQSGSTGKKHDSDVDLFVGSVPGTQKVWIKTYGCSHNISDSEYMEGILTSYGFRITENPNDANIWLLNSCTVKDPSQAAFMHLVRKAKEKSFPVVVAGCVSQADRKLPGLEDVSIVGITQIDRIVEAIEQTLQGNTVKMLTKKALPSLDLPKVRRNPLIEIIPLSTGCLGSCTYCKTRQARGKLGSYALESIVNRARKAVVEDAVAEIWLSSEDTGAYGRDIGTDIGQLLKSLISILPTGAGILCPSIRSSDAVPCTYPSMTADLHSEGGTMLRIGMTNPPYILEHLAVIAEILKHPSVYSFLHIPVQAASNKVLLGMNREYTVEEFRTVADYLIAHVPGITIATDIICGFPNEDEDDFSQTMELIQHYRFAITNISQFYPRPGTPAAKMKRIATNIVKDRSRRLTKLFESFTPYVDLVGTTVLVWFDIEVASLNGQANRRIDDGDVIITQSSDIADKGGNSSIEGQQQSVGHTKSYVKVLVPHDARLPGSCCYVSVHGCQRFHIEGRVLSFVYLARRPSSLPLTQLKSFVDKVAVSSSSSISTAQCTGSSCSGGSCSSTNPTTPPRKTDGWTTAVVSLANSMYTRACATIAACSPSFKLLSAPNIKLGVLLVGSTALYLQFRHGRWRSSNV